MSIISGYARISFPGICLLALLSFFVPILGIAQATIVVVCVPGFGSNEGFNWGNSQSNEGLFSKTTFTEDIFGFAPEKFLADSSNGKSSLTSDSLQFSISVRNKLSWQISEKKEVCVPDSANSTREEVLAGWTVKYVSAKLLLQAGL